MPTVKKYQQDTDKQKRAYDYFVSNGYSPQAAAGIVGNLVHESNLNTTIEGDKGYRGGSSFGIAQFRGERLKNLKSRYGDKWTDFDNQLEYVKYELENTHQKANNILKATTDVYEAGQAFSDYYEIPAVKYKDNKDRQSKVSNIFEKFTKGNITENFTNYEIPNNNVNFTESPVELQKLPQEEKKAQEIAQSLKQQTNEFNFLKDLQNFQFSSPQIPQQTLDTVQTKAPDVLGIYQQVSQFVENPLMQQGGVIEDDAGQWKYPGQITKINSGNITMMGVNYPLLGVDNLGNAKLMMPNQDYKFEGTSVTEYPLQKYFSK